MNFPLGRVAGTPAALQALAAAGADVRELLGRHARGDWGVVSMGDARLNDQALRDGTRPPEFAFPCDEHPSPPSTAMQ